MYAMRLARAHTGREKILKFEGGYHGMSDNALMSLAPQVMVNYPVAVPDSAGILESVRDNTVVCPWADPEVFVQLLDEDAGQIAGVIIEPLQRIIPPPEGWLELVRAETAKRDIVLIFDEVVTGYRLAYGGAQERYGVVPDLCTLGKIVGGGFALAAIAGSDAIMAHFDKGLVGPEGFTYQVGTLSGNPIAATAGLKTMEILRRPGAYDRIAANGRSMMQAAEAAFARAGIPVQVVGDPVLFELVFTDKPVRNYRDVLTSDKTAEACYNALMRQHGVLKPPGKVYTHLGLTDEDLALVNNAFAETAAQMGREGLGPEGKLPAGNFSGVSPQISPRRFLSASSQAVNGWNSGTKPRPLSASDDATYCEVTTSTTAGAFWIARAMVAERSTGSSTRSPCAPKARAIAA